jgi:uncharacterized lipoprotein YddW (UPF0748 family)
MGVRRTGFRAASVGLLAILLPACLMGATASPEAVPIALWAYGDGAGLRDQDSVATLVQTASECGFNTLVPIVCVDGVAHYRSLVNPRGENVDPAFRDPLAAVLSAARNAEEPGRAPLRVLAGMDVLLIHRGATLPPRDHVALRHPEWLMQDRVNGTTQAREEGVITEFLDPTIEEVRQHLADVAQELARNYELDGLVLDNIRYPEGGQEWGYEALALERYHEAVGDVGIPSPGDPTWCSYRREQVTALLRGIVEAVHAVRPDLPIYVCAETPGPLAGDFSNSLAYTELLQDWPRWVEEGLCSGLVVKIFRDGLTESGPAEFTDWLRFARDFASRTREIIAVSGHLNYRNTLFQQMRVILGHGGQPVGLGLYDCDDPARDYEPGFYSDLRVAVFQTQHMDRTNFVPPASGEAAVNLGAPLPTAPTTRRPPGARRRPPRAASPESAFPESELLPMTPMEVSPSPFALEPARLPETEPFNFSEIAPSRPAEPRAVSAQESREADEIELGTLTPSTSATAPGAVETLFEPEEGATGAAQPPSERPRQGVFEGVPAPAIPRPSAAQSPAAGGGDVITLSDGRQVQGQITEEYEQYLTIRLDSGNAVRIPRSRVRSIQRAGQ